MRLADRYAVLGHPVAHSQSPFIHARFAAECGQHLVYERVECPLDGFEAGLRAYLASADASRGLGPVRGVNITVPFKFQVLPLAAQATERAQRAQAANVLRFDTAAGGPERPGGGAHQASPGWWADNTDGVGLVRDIEAQAGVALAGRRLLLVGAGGAGAGVLGPLIEAGPAEVVVANRHPANAQALVARHAAWAERHGCRLGACGLQAPGEAFDVLINASASSLAGVDSPVGPQVLRPGTLAVDLMYGQAARPFLAWAQDHGAIARDGLGMLVEQAAEAFFAWRGLRPSTAPVLAALRARLQAQAAPAAAAHARPPAPPAPRR